MSNLPVNGARGEVALRIGNVDLVIAAEMGRLAAVSTAIDCKSFVDLYQRLLSVEIAATMAAVQHLAVRGDVASAMTQLRLSDFPACKNAFSETLNHYLGDEPEGKDDAAKGAAAKR